MENYNGKIDEIQLAFEGLLNVDIFAEYDDEPQNNDFYAGMTLEELLDFRMISRKISYKAKENIE
jgi:hypothetical protein